MSAADLEKKARAEFDTRPWNNPSGAPNWDIQPEKIKQAFRNIVVTKVASTGES